MNDSASVDSLLKELRVEMDTKSLKIFRFAKKAGGSTKLSPVKVQFDSVKGKLRVLRAAKNLKVFINQDLTPTELAVQNQLRSERETRNDQLEETDQSGRKYGTHKFGGQTATKLYWVTRSGELKRIKILTE